MSAQLIFDPSKLTFLQCPFTFFIKDTSGKEVKFEYQEYTDENLQSIYAEDYDQDSLKIFAKLTADELKKEENKYISHYHKLNPKKDLVDYIEKYLSDYYFKSFHQIFNILSRNQKLYHKIQTGEKRFKNLACSFDRTQVPELSFKIERKGKKLSIVTFFQLHNEIYRATDISHFRFLICCEEAYYMLKKPDWQVLEQSCSATSYRPDPPHRAGSKSLCL